MPGGKLRQRLDKSGEMEWTCGDCLTLQVGQKDADTHRRRKSGAEDMLTCSRCGPLPKNAFSESDAHHATNPNRVTLCRNCRSPACTNPSCPTCRICRDASCRLPGQCGKSLVPVNPKVLPETEQERLRFLCHNCRFPSCQRCNRPMPKGSRQRFSKSGGVEWTCAICSGQEA